jgi:hypothetical protein
MINRGAFLCIGGPALVWYVTPTEEEIFKVCLLCHMYAPDSCLCCLQRYSPELQKKALAGREQRQKDFDAFVGQLKEAARSDKPSKCCCCSHLQDCANDISLGCTEGNGCKEVRGRTADSQGGARCICC